MGTQSALKQRIQAIQNAEETLVELAYKMGSDDNESSKKEVSITIFDTIISKSSVACLDRKDVSCLLLGTNKTKSEDDLVIHGVYAESKLKVVSEDAKPLV